ncbi:recombinase family protein [Algoriphagus halophilus]|uniref:recombinase family protein n=1 Tax=Algoriphagus halophilus TaxID=226505 RepID=UPI0009409148|nr:recombinase family protein [Algoriphagus halophilus]
MNVISYSRVSTDEQAEKGFSLSHQEEAIKRYCHQKGYNLIQSFKEDYTGFKDFNRPEWLKLEQYIKENRGLVKGVICLRWDRFSRNEPEASAKVREFRKKGIEIIMTESYADPKSIEGDFLNSIHMHIAQMESKKISQRTKDGMRRAMVEGCWMYRAPFGYVKIRNANGKSTLEPHPDHSKIVKEVFQKMASGIYTAEEVRKIYYNDLGKMGKNNFLLLLRRVVFTGRIKVNKTDLEPEQIVLGLHPPIISIKLFDKVQEVMYGRKVKLRSSEQNIEEYPLKAFLFCADHNRALTGSGSRSRNKKIHHYYHCTKSKCKNRFSTKLMDSLILNFFSKLKFPEEVVSLYQEIIIKELKDRGENRKKNKKSLNSELEKLNKKYDYLKSQFLDQGIDSETFMELKQGIKNQIQKLEYEKEHSDNEFIPFLSLFEKSLRVLQDLEKYYVEADGETKQKLVGSIFSGKIEFSDKEVRTASYKDFISRIFLISNNLETGKMKKADKNIGFFTLAPPLGLEPRTL